MLKVIKRYTLRLRNAFEIINDAKSNNWDDKIKAWTVITPLLTIACLIIVLFLDYIVSSILGWQ
jgi:hypothetical protein